MTKQKNKIVISGKQAGMFFEINSFLSGLAYADYYGYEVEINWKRCIYSYEKEDGWDLFFKPLRSDKPTIFTTNSRDKRFTPFNYACPRGLQLPKYYREKYNCSTFLMPPSNPQKSHIIIMKYIQPNPYVLDEIRRRMNNIDFSKKVIGVHMRSSGRIHGGVPWLLDKLNQGNPPYEEYAKYIDNELDDDAIIILCTDGKDVSQEIKNRYNDRVFVTSQYLPKSFEECKESYKKNSIQIDKHSIGLDIIADAYILAHCDVFIHGNSNVSNFVQCLNPKLRHYDIYEHLYPGEK